jgi:hypothetical protein
MGGLAALAIAICICYWFGLRGLWLFVAPVIAWFPVYLACMFVFTRIRPVQFEPFRPPPPPPSSLLKEPEFVTLFPREDADGDKPNKADRTEDEPPKES